MVSFFMLRQELLCILSWPDQILGDGQGGLSEKPSSDDISPCSTLFIANLSPSCTEEELKQMLSEYHGLQVLKMQKKFGKPVAFADFSVTTPLLFKMIPAIIHLGFLLRWFPLDSSQSEMGYKSDLLRVGSVKRITLLVHDPHDS